MTGTPTWRAVPGYEGLYDVSDHGIVRSVDRVVFRGFSTYQRGRELRPWRCTGGYPCVYLYGRPDVVRRRHAMKVHHLVLLAFVGPAPDGMQACHGDDVPTNNHLSNLRWGTKPTNMRDMIRNGGHRPSNQETCLNGHGLRPPNLGSDRHRRRCLACNRARGAHQRAKRLGIPFDVRAHADAEYRRILERAVS